MKSMNQAGVEEFDRNGFVVIEGILDPIEDIEPLVDEYSALLDGMIERGYAQGKLASRYQDLSLGRRASTVMGEGLSLYPDFDISFQHHA
jgi:hypothetical protein